MLTGVVGSIKWHHYTAAGIHGYTATRSKDGTRWFVTASVVLSDAFKMAQTPLTFVATHAKGQWRFPILTLQHEGHTLTATCGPPQT